MYLALNRLSISRYMACGDSFLCELFYQFAFVLFEEIDELLTFYMVFSLLLTNWRSRPLFILGL